MLSETQTQVIARHLASAGTRDGQVVPQWPGAASVYHARTGKLWVFNPDTPRRSGYSELVFHSVDGTLGTVTSSRAPLLWDLRRPLTAREVARAQGFPEDFQLPTTRVQHCLGNAVPVPMAAWAIRRVVEGGEGHLRLLDLASGIGGFHVACRAVVPGVACVGYSEVFRAAVLTYEGNFPSSPALGDAREVTDWPATDLLCCGIPCQSYSHATTARHRQSHPERDFYQVLLHAVRSSGAKRVVLECVPNILTLGASRHRCLVQGLSDLGFRMEEGVLNLLDFGLPQGRQRWLLVGRRDGTPLPLERPRGRRDARIRDILD